MVPKELCSSVYTPSQCDTAAPPIRRWRPVTSLYQRNGAEETLHKSQSLGHKRHYSLTSYTFKTWRSPHWRKPSLN